MRYINLHFTYLPTDSSPGEIETPGFCRMIA